MQTFTWRDILTVSVGEMNRAQGLDCARHFEILKGAMPSVETLLHEADMLVCLYAPAVVTLRGEILADGERVIDLEEHETLRLALPLTRDVFLALPMSLTEQWIAAAVTSNDWFVDALKKALSLALETSSVPESGSAPSSEPTTISLPMPTTGA